MSDYSDIIQIIGAMLVVSLLVQNANRANVANTKILIESEYENQVATVAQDIMEESKALPFDEQTVTGFVPVNIPNDFSTVGLDGGESSDRSSFDDFDDYHDWVGKVETDQGEFNVEVLVNYIDNSSYEVVATRTTLKQMTIKLSSPSLTESDNKTPKEYSFDFIRSYYAD